MQPGNRWIRGSWCAVVALAVAASSAVAATEDFKLTRAIPSEAMLAVHSRTHDGQKFVAEQFERVWAEFEKQNFSRDIRRLLENAVKQSGGDPNEFSVQWQKINDLMAVVDWKALMGGETAFAMRLAPPMGSEMIVLSAPAADAVGPNFDGLLGLMKALVELAGPGVFIASEDGEGESRMYRAAVRDAVPPISFTLARQGGVILIGFGSSFPEQSLALLRGESDASATLGAGARFKKAMAELPPPTDSMVFVDIAKLMGESRSMLELLVKTMQPPVGSQPSTQPTPNLDFLPKVVQQLDLWEYAATVASTEGMKTNSTSVVLVRESALNTPMGKTFYANPPIAKPFKYVPKIATTVSANSGFSWRSLYDAVVGFIEKEVDGGDAMIAQWNAQKASMPIDLEADLLSWIGGEYVTFSAPVPTPFMPGSVVIMPVRDAAAAQGCLDKVGALVNEGMAQQNGGVEDAKLPGADGFKRVILPPMFAMMPGLGRPLYGLRDGQFILSNGPEVVTASLQAAAGEAETFEKNERYVAEGLPLPDKMVAFSFADLSSLGDQLGQMLSMVGLVRMMAPEVAQDPVANSMLAMITKLGNVARKLDFFKSSCAVKTFEKNIERTVTVTHYQEPPKPKSAAQPGDSGAEPAPAGDGDKKAGAEPGKG